MIPFNSLGKQNGMLLGIKADYLIIKNQGEERKIKDVVIGLYDGKLTKDETYNS